jgi:hypothetical protein
VSLDRSVMISADSDGFEVGAQVETRSMLRSLHGDR